MRVSDAFQVSDVFVSNHFFDDIDMSIPVALSTYRERISIIIAVNRRANVAGLVSNCIVNWLWAKP